jgi:hypothetical protein
MDTKIEVASPCALLEQVLSDRKKKVVSFEEISEMNKSLPFHFRLQDDLEISKFLKCFHNNGFCLYFEDERLREHAILDIQWFSNAFSKLIADKNHINKDCKRRYITDWNSFNETGELEYRLVKALWKDESSYINHKREIMSYMEKLLMVVPISTTGATSESQLSWYIPCMNKKVFGKDIFERDWGTSSVLCFRFPSFAMFVFYRLIAYCIGSLKWEVSVDEKGIKSLYQTAGVFDYENHTVVVCINIKDNDIQVQVMRINPLLIDIKISQKVGRSIADALQELSKTFHAQTMYEKGYKCQNSICEENNQSFYPASKLSNIKEKVTQCAVCPLPKKHDINVPSFLSFWEKVNKFTSLIFFSVIRLYMVQ